MSAEFNVRNPSELFMLPIQEVKITTTNGRVFFVHLENWAEDHFECKLAALNLGPRLTADAIFGPFTKGKTALAAFEALILSLRLSLAKHDELDQISLVDNLCNTEFVSASEQKKVLGEEVVVKVNGVGVTEESARSTKSLN